MAMVSTGLYACERRKTIKVEEQMNKKTIKPAFSKTWQTKEKKSAVHQENPRIVLYCIVQELYISAATLSLACVAGTKKEGEGRGGEGEKSAKGKREREPFLLSSITSFTPPSVWPTTPATYFPRLFKKRATNFNCQKRQKLSFTS